MSKRDFTENNARVYYHRQIISVNLRWCSLGLHAVGSTCPLKRSERRRIAQLVKAEETLREEFNSFIKSPGVVARAQQLSTTAGGQNLDLGNLNKLRNSLQQLGPHAVLLYPLILEDRLELVLVTPDSPP